MRRDNAAAAVTARKQCRGHVAAPPATGAYAEAFAKRFDAGHAELGARRDLVIGHGFAHAYIHPGPPEFAPAKRPALDDTNENDYRLIVSDAQPPRSKNDAPALKISQTLGHAPRRMTSGELLGSDKELVIEHAGREYRLRLTQNGKLILTA